MDFINIDKWRKLNYSLFNSYVETYSLLEGNNKLEPGKALVTAFNENNIRGKLKEENYGTAYTIARELGIYYEKDNEFHLSRIARKFKNNEISYTNYLKFYCLNTELIINELIVSPFEEIVDALRGNSLKVKEIAIKCKNLIPNTIEDKKVDSLKYFIDRCVESSLLKKNNDKYYLNYNYNLLKGSINKSNFDKNKFISLFISGDQKKNQENLVKMLIERDISPLLFQISLISTNLKFHSQLITRYIASLATKPFVLLSGLSGSGKTKLAQAFAYWICENDTQYKIVPVGADWTNREPLLGYVNALDNTEYIIPENGALELLIEANKPENSDKPYFLILDEMNLSHVERYFADFLSVMESKDKFKLHSSKKNLNMTNDDDKFKDTTEVPNELGWPKNLFVVGTVNIDETTYMFSPKVLDRANVIEFRVNKDEIEEFLKQEDKEINLKKLEKQGSGMASAFLQIVNDSLNIKEDEILNKTLVEFFKELQKVGAEFGYRTAMEISKLYHQLSVIDKNIEARDKIDIAIMQKLLPKLHGSRRKLIPVLDALGSLCLKEINNKTYEENKKEKNIKYYLSLEKIERMKKNAVDNGFASYAEA